MSGALLASDLSLRGGVEARQRSPGGREPKRRHPHRSDVASRPAATAQRPPAKTSRRTDLFFVLVSSPSPSLSLSRVDAPVPLVETSSAGPESRLNRESSLKKREETKPDLFPLLSRVGSLLSAVNAAREGEKNEVSRPGDAAPARRRLLSRAGQRCLQGAAGQGESDGEEKETEEEVERGFTRSFSPKDNGQRLVLSFF